MRAKVCVADWNGDGRLDLLVGDFATQKPEPARADAGGEGGARSAARRTDEVQNQHLSELFRKATSGIG